MVPLWLRHAKPQLGCDRDILIVNYCHKASKQCILFEEHVHALRRVTSGLSYAPTDLFPANVACHHQCWLVLYSHDLCMTAAWNLACMTFGHEPQICVCVCVCGYLGSCLCGHAHFHSKTISAHSALPHPRCFCQPSRWLNCYKDVWLKASGTHVSSVEDGTDLLQGEVFELQ